MTRIRFNQIELSLIASAIGVYLLSLGLPDLFPEHSTNDKGTLYHYLSVFSALAKTYRDFDVVMREKDTIIIDEAVQGFMRICERIAKDMGGYSQTILLLNYIHKKLEYVQLAARE